MSARRSTEVSNRRNEILAAAAELFATKGFAGTTVRDIADSVGILSGSLYHHFNAKEDMVEEIFTAYFDELAARWDEALALDTDAITRFESMLRANFENVDRHPAAARLFTHEWLDLRHLRDFAARWDEIEAMWLRVIRDGVAQGQFRADIDPALLFSVAMDLIRGLSGWYHPGGRYTIDTLTDAYIGVLMNGLVADGASSGDAKAPKARSATKAVTASKAPAKKRAAHNGSGAAAKKPAKRAAKGTTATKA